MYIYLNMCTHLHVQYSTSYCMISYDANSNNDINTLTSFSESPRHLLTIDEADMLKNVVLHSVATALASRVFPVPYKDENMNK